MPVIKENIKVTTEMFKEASDRMEVLGINQEIIFRFLVKTELQMSDNTKITDVPEDILKQIKEYQDEFKNLVYHVIHTHFMGMETYECLTVSPYKEDWDYERPDKKKWVMSHSINITIPEYTESGSIEVVNKNGVLCRIN